jgi:hypothetical protein
LKDAQNLTPSAQENNKFNLPTFSFKSSGRKTEKKTYKPSPKLLGKNEVTTSCALVVQVRSPKCKISHFNLNSQGKTRLKTIKVKNFEMNQTIKYPVDVHQCKCEAQNVLLLVSASLRGLVHDVLQSTLYKRVPFSSTIFINSGDFNAMLFIKLSSKAFITYLVPLFIPL